MKKYLFYFLLFVTILTTAQEKKTDSVGNYNELKLNGLMAVIGAFEVGYERTVNDESSFGISVLLPYDKQEAGLEYYISPYYRYFFGKGYASGFFIEGFGMLNSAEQVNFIFGTDEYKTDFALGIGLGGKWITKKGLKSRSFSLPLG